MKPEQQETTAVLVVLPGNRRQDVQQHSVNRLEARCNRGKKRT
jgi:hypothetical protein